MKRLLVMALLAGEFCGSAGEIFDFYYKRRPDDQRSVRGVGVSTRNPNGRSYGEITATNHGITEIGIERCGSDWGGPVYTFVAKRDGTFEYKGEKEVERTGEFTGTIPVRQFDELSRFVRDSGYMAFENEYRLEVTGQSTTFTTVVRDGKRKVIRNYANSGPTALWAIEQLIDDLMSKAQLKAGLPKPPPPLLPKVTPYENDPVLRAGYLELFQKGYLDAWEGKESLPAFNPTTDIDKTRTIGYAEGMIAGRGALAKWFGTNSPPASLTNTTSQSR